MVVQYSLTTIINQFCMVDKAIAIEVIISPELINIRCDYKFYTNEKSEY